MGHVTAALLGFHERFIDAPRTRRVAATLAELIGPAGTVLDVGCGDGEVGRALARLAGCEVTGVDVDPLPGAARYDGARLPSDDGAFDAVVLSDVLHHARDRELLLSEALRVARRRVVIKDHYRFGPVSSAVLLAMDRVGNAARPGPRNGPYFSPDSFRAFVERAGATVVACRWPLRVHDLPFRIVARDRLHFAAAIERRATVSPR